MSKLVIYSTNTNVLLSPRAIASSSLHTKNFGLIWWFENSSSMAKTLCAWKHHTQYLSFFTPSKFSDRGHIEPVAIGLYVQNILNVRRNLPALRNDKCEKLNKVWKSVFFFSCCRFFWEWHQQYRFRNEDIGEQIMFISIENLKCCCIPKLCETKLKGKSKQQSSAKVQLLTLLGPLFKREVQKFVVPSSYFSSSWTVSVHLFFLQTYKIAQFFSSLSLKAVMCHIAKFNVFFIFNLITCSPSEINCSKGRAM